MQQRETISTVGPLLRSRALQALLVAAPAVTTTVAILTAAESNLALAIVLNVAAGVIISGSLFIAVSSVARQIADERVDLAQATEAGIWRVRATRLAIESDGAGLYTDWYWRLRLQEEIERSRRYDLHFAVLRVNLLDLHQDAEAQAASAWLGDHLRRHLRRSDLPALLRDGGLGIMLPNTGQRRAQTLERRLTKAFASLNAQVGLACFPGDGEDVGQLLTAAANAATEQPKLAAAA